MKCVGSNDEDDVPEVSGREGRREGGREGGKADSEKKMCVYFFFKIKEEDDVPED